MPKVLTASPTQQAWMDSHRCVVCNGEPRKVKNEMVEEHRQLRPEYRHMAVIPGPHQPYMTEHVGGEYLCEVECENGHLFRCHYHKFKS